MSPDPLALRENMSVLDMITQIMLELEAIRDRLNATEARLARIELAVNMFGVIESL